MKAICIAVLLLAGCATTAPHGPNGRAVHHIETVGSAKAYRMAGEKCPLGYNILTSRQQGLFFVLDVECKA